MILKGFVTKQVGTLLIYPINCVAGKSVAHFTKLLTTLHSLVNWFHHPLLIEGGQFLFQEAF